MFAAGATWATGGTRYWSLTATVPFICGRCNRAVAADSEHTCVDRRKGVDPASGGTPGP